MKQPMDCWIIGLLDCCNLGPEEPTPAVLQQMLSTVSAIEPQHGESCLTLHVSRFTFRALRITNHPSTINPLIHQSITPFSARA